MATDPKLDEFLGEKPVPTWRRHLKWIIGGVGLLLVLFVLWRLFLGGSGDVQYATQEVRRGNLSVSVSATGKLAPTNQVQIGSELSGLVEQVYVDVNDRVTKGQALATLDTSRLDDAIAQSQAALNAQQASVAQAAATVQESQAQLARMQEVSRLSGGRVPAKVEMEQAQAAVARANAGLRAAQANVVSSRAALSSNLTQRAKAVIRSPVNGVVLARQIEQGATVAASFNTPTLFVIAEDLTAMELEVAIDEADVGAVKEGQPATFIVDAFPGRSFTAQIIRVDLGSNLSAQTATATTANTVVSYAATLSVSNPDLQLRPGMTATAEITTMSKPDVLLVPNAALRFTPATPQASTSKSGIASALVPGRPNRRGNAGASKSAGGAGPREQTVYVLDEANTPQPVNVTVGATNGSMTEITGGELKPGARVVTGQMASGASEGRRSGSGSGQRRQSGGGQGGGQRGG